MTQPAATFVQGDTRPSVYAVIHDKGNPDAPVNLTGATVRFQMRKADDNRYTVDAAATVTNAASGSVRYDWAATNLSVPGEYDIQWEVTFVDSKVQTTSDPIRILVRRQ